MRTAASLLVVSIYPAWNSCSAEPLEITSTNERTAGTTAASVYPSKAATDAEKPAGKTGPNPLSLIQFGVDEHVDHSDTVHTIPYAAAFAGQKPIVIAGVPTMRGVDFFTIRVREVSSQSFVMFGQESSCGANRNDAGKHTYPERVPWVAVAPGRHQLKDGTVFEAGVVELENTVTNGQLTREVKTVSFQSEIKNAVILATVQTMNDGNGDPVFPRIGQKSNTGFQIHMQEDEGSEKSESGDKGQHAKEVVGWLAISSGNGKLLNKRFTAFNPTDYATNTDGSKGAVNDNWHTVHHMDDQVSYCVFGSVGSHSQNSAILRTRSSIPPPPLQTWPNHCDSAQDVGDAQALFTFVDDAAAVTFTDGTRGMQLTQNDRAKVGAAFANTYIDPNDFEVEFEMYVGHIDETDVHNAMKGADGMTFTLVDAELWNGKLPPGLGTCLGSCGLPGYTIEFDTFHNFKTDSTVKDHVAVWQNGVGGKKLTGDLELTNIEDGRWHSVKLKSKDGKLKVRVDDVDRIDMDNFFPGITRAKWGFTAATGGEKNEHKVRNVKFCGSKATEPAEPVGCNGNSQNWALESKGASCKISWLGSQTTKNCNWLVDGITSNDALSTDHVLAPEGTHATVAITIEFQAAVKLDTISVVHEKLSHMRGYYKLQTMSADGNWITHGTYDSIPHTNSISLIPPGSSEAQQLQQFNLPVPAFLGVDTKITRNLGFAYETHAIRFVGDLNKIAERKYWIRSIEATHCTHYAAAPVPTPAPTTTSGTNVQLKVQDDLCHDSVTNSVYEQVGVLVVPECEATTDYSSPNGGVGGDPFVVDQTGKRVQFFLPLGQEEKLLVCKEQRALTIFGTAFGTGEKQDHQQWFNKFRVTVEDKEVITVSIRSNQTEHEEDADITAPQMHQQRLKLVNVAVEGEKMSRTGAVGTSDAILVAVWATPSHETVQLSDGSNVFQIKSAIAHKFVSANEQKMYSHLDLRFVELETSQCTEGILAEIWGLASMTQRTAAMLEEPGTNSSSYMLK